jgi:hypothetical protein
MRQVHLGARLPDSLALPHKTYELDTQTTVSAVSDLTKGLIQLGYPYAECHRITMCYGNRFGLRQEAPTTGAERLLAKERMARSVTFIINNNLEDGVT